MRKPFSDSSEMALVMLVWRACCQCRKAMFVRRGSVMVSSRYTSELTHALLNLQLQRLICIPLTKRFAKPSQRLTRKSWSLAAGQIVSVKGSNLIIVVYMLHSHCVTMVMKRSWSTVIRKPYPPISIPLIACTSNR